MFDHRRNKTDETGNYFRTFLMEIKRWMMPAKAVYKDRFHHLQDLILNDKRIKDAYIFFAFFLFVYVFGALVGMAYGYPARLALFESVSATANVGFIFFRCGLAV